MFNSNEPIKVAHLQKLANQSLLNGALVMEIINNSFSESIMVKPAGLQLYFKNDSGTSLFL